MTADFSKEAFYQQLLDIGSQLGPFEEVYRTSSNRVEGCQTLMYLHTDLRAEQLYFSADADALISRGIAALWIQYYQGCSPQSLWVPPPFLPLFEQHLSMNRTQGALAFWHKMKQQTVILLTEATKTSLSKLELLTPVL